MKPTQSQGNCSPIPLSRWSGIARERQGIVPTACTEVIYCGDVLTFTALSCCCFPTPWQYDFRWRQRNDCDPAPRNCYEMGLGHAATVRFELCTFPADSRYEPARILGRDWLARKRLDRCIGGFARFVYSVLSAGSASYGCVSVLEQPSVRDDGTSRSACCGSWHRRGNRLDSHPAPCQRRQQAKNRSVCRRSIPAGGSLPCSTDSSTSSRCSDRRGSAPSETAM
jgi:hypothetical protein